MGSVKQCNKLEADKTMDFIIYKTNKNSLYNKKKTSQIEKHKSSFVHNSRKKRLAKINEIKRSGCIKNFINHQLDLSLLPILDVFTTVYFYSYQ